MRIIAAYLLAVLGGNENPKSEDITHILSSVGIEADKERLEQVLKSLHGKNVDQLIAEGYSKLATVSAPAAGGVSAGAGSSAAPADEGKKDAGGKKEEAKKEDKKKKEEEEEEADADMGGLFGGDDEDGY